MKQIPFSKPTIFQGRNGTFKASGLDIFESTSKSIFLSPITSRGKVGNCYIEIPLSEVESLIEYLKNLIP